MKIIITENQYRVLLREDRVQYLRTQNVISPEVLDQSVEGSNEKEDKRMPGGMNPDRVKVEPIESTGGIDIAYIITNKKGKQSIKFTNEIFDDIVESDPTNNKEYVQWILNLMTSTIKEGRIAEAIRYITEDLPEIKTTLKYFDEVKDKKIFKRSAPNLPNAPQDVKNINQYKNHLLLWSIVQKFINVEEEEGSENPLWSRLKQFIDIGEAKIVYRDNDVLVYTPLSVESSCSVLPNLENRADPEHVVNWCTNRRGYSNWNRYRLDHLKPDGTQSDFYVVIPKESFDMSLSELRNSQFPLQFHFESNQMKNRENSDFDFSIVNRFSGLKKFFQKELGKLVEMDVRRGTGLMDSSYIKYLNKFGGKVGDFISDEAYEEGVENIKRLASEQVGPLQQNRYLKWLMENTTGVNIVEFLDTENTSNLDFSNMSIGEIPDLSSFKNLNRIAANNCGLTRLPPIEYLPIDAPLAFITLTNNNITNISLRGYERLTSLLSLVLNGNPIREINVDDLKKMVQNNEDFLRLGLDNSIIGNLTPENKSEYESFLSNEGSGLYRGNE